LAKMAQSCGVDFQRELRTGQSVARAIVDAASELGCDLVFIASQGMAGADETALGSVTAKVLALSTVPVLVYRGGTDAPDEGVGDKA
jgi:nucleotide-binding universal stress UspA family protein